MRTGKITVDGVSVVWTEVPELEIITMVWQSLKGEIMQNYFCGKLSKAGDSIRSTIKEYKRQKDPVIQYDILMSAEMLNWIYSAAPQFYISNVSCEPGRTIISMASEASSALVDLESCLKDTGLAVSRDGEQIIVTAPPASNLDTLSAYVSRLELAMNFLDPIELASANAWFGWINCAIEYSLEIEDSQMNTLIEEVEALIDSAAM